MVKQNVTNYHKMINIKKNAGPGGTCGRTLKLCADQVSGAFQHLVQTFLDIAIIPVAWENILLLFPFQIQQPPNS